MTAKTHQEELERLQTLQQKAIMGKMSNFVLQTMCRFFCESPVLKLVRLAKPMLMNPLFLQELPNYLNCRKTPQS